MTQLSHSNTDFKKQSFQIILICDGVTNAPNIGSLFRIADAFGVEELIFCGHDVPIGRRMTKTSRSTEKYVNHRVEDDINTVISEFKAKAYQLYALEITDNSKAIHTVTFNTHKPLALIIGHENFGISDAILNQVDATVHIDMFGHNSSMNVVQATSIALYEITKQIIG